MRYVSSGRWLGEGIVAEQMQQIPSWIVDGGRTVFWYDESVFLCTF
jgi:hypothetical protein